MTRQSQPTTATADHPGPDIARFNDTAVPFPDSVALPTLIEAQFDKRPTATAVFCDHDQAFGKPSLTYAELNAKVNQLAHRLRSEGVGPGHIVAIMVERSLAMIIGILGVVKSGAAYLPVSPDHPSKRVEFILANAAVDVLLVQPRTFGRVRFSGTTIDLEDPATYRGPTTNPPVLNKPDDLAYVIYTSGSTGTPKGVMIEHRSLINRLHWMQQAYPIGGGDVLLQKTPFFFDVSVWELFWWALEGATLSFLLPGGEANPLAIVDAVCRHRISVIHFVPSMLNVFLEYLEGKAALVVGQLLSIRQVFASGEALSAAHVRKFNDVWGSRTGAKLTNLYGPTEATIDVSYFDCPPHNEFETVPIGRPINNIRLHVISEGREATVGQTGELCIAGVGVARGYLNNPQLTNERFVGNPTSTGERIYRTGDLARWLPDGNLEYLGREDFQIKIRGLRIELGEIESTLRHHPAVADCLVIVKKFAESVDVIVAYIVAKSEVRVEDLKMHARRHLPDYMVPNHFERLPRIPLTTSGKADRHALPEPRFQNDGP